MTAVLLALSSAISYGSADFIGGMASRRIPASAVVLRSNVVGVTGLALVLPFVPGVFSGRDAVIGAIGGLIGGTGVLLLYRGLAMASMSVVAPITAVLAGVVPVVAGLLGGERPSALAFCGIAVGLIAITCIAREDDDGKSEGATSAPVILMAASAGLCFGLFFVAFDMTSDDAGLWPGFTGKAATVTMFTLVALLRPSARPDRDAAWKRDLVLMLAAAGCFEAAANALFLLATQHGELTVVAVLTALYPATTIILAGIFLHERLSRLQLGGVGLAGAAIVLITAG